MPIEVKEVRRTYEETLKAWEESRSALREFLGQEGLVGRRVRITRDSNLDPEQISRTAYTVSLGTGGVRVIQGAVDLEEVTIRSTLTTVQGTLLGFCQIPLAETLPRGTMPCYPGIRSHIQDTDPKRGNGIVIGRNDIRYLSFVVIPYTYFSNGEVLDSDQ